MAGHDISAGGLITTLLEMCFANMEGGMEIILNKIKEAMTLSRYCSPKIRVLLSR